MIKKYFMQLLSVLKDPMVSFLGAVSTFLAPIAGIVLSALVLAVVDLVVKLGAVHRTEGFQSITSSKMKTTLDKMMLYAVLIITCHMLDVLFLDKSKDLFGWFFSSDTAEMLTKAKLASLASFVIVIREIKSIDENWKTAFGWSFLETILQMRKLITKSKNTKSENGE